MLDTNPRRWTVEAIDNHVSVLRQQKTTNPSALDDLPQLIRASRTRHTFSFLTFSQGRPLGIGFAAKSNRIVATISDGRVIWIPLDTRPDAGEPECRVFAGFLGMKPATVNVRPAVISIQLSRKEPFLPHSPLAQPEIE